ncbi:MAG: hypothetical protein V2I26_09540 [Halieaceae bacterium]|jgi:hypothetical protein|nr:hypothetical protein [Halieaceae bacterium]
MKYLQAMLLAALLAVMATTAHARGSKFSLLECGLQLGGITSTSTRKASSVTSAKRERSSKRAVRSILVTDPALYSYTGTQTNLTGRRRMPPTFTLAKLGCAW